MPRPSHEQSSHSVHPVGGVRRRDRVRGEHSVNQELFLSFFFFNVIGLFRNLERKRLKLQRRLVRSDTAGFCIPAEVERWLASGVREETRIGHAARVQCRETGHAERGRTVRWSSGGASIPLSYRLFLKP